MLVDRKGRSIEKNEPVPESRYLGEEKAAD